MKQIELKIPNLGEAEETEIIEISVKKGDKLKKNDPIIVLESEKAAMEVPSDYDGTIMEIKVKEGDNVKEGTIFALMEILEKDSNQKVDENKNIKSNNLVDSVVTNSAKNKIENTELIKGSLNAGPAVRKIARELEIDLKKIQPTGRNNKVTKEDLKNYIHSRVSLDNNISSYKEEELSKFGDYSILKQTKIRSIGAKNLHKSWVSIPHVTHYDQVDLTKYVSQMKSIKGSTLSYVIRGLTKALQKFPIFNSALLSEDNIMLRNYINIGIAVDTEDGLVVPVLHDADKLTVVEIDQAVSELASKARTKKLLKQNFEGSTFTVSSLGKIGGLGFTPIINPPEVAILALSNFQKKLVLENGTVKENTYLPISMSYDHRVINGGDAGRFMVYLKDILET